MSVRWISELFGLHGEITQTPYRETMVYQDEHRMDTRGMVLVSLVQFSFLCFVVYLFLDHFMLWAKIGAACFSWRWGAVWGTSGECLAQTSLQSQKLVGAARATSLIHPSIPLTVVPFGESGRMALSDATPARWPISEHLRLRVT